MFPKKIIHKNFMASFLGERTLAPFYEKAHNSIENKTIYNEPVKDETAIDENLYIIEDVPDYLNLSHSKEHSHISIKKVTLYEGYLIDFTKFSGLEDYLKTHFGKSSRSKLRRYINRLELCFPITYKMYFGEISREHYDFIFNRFKQMLNRRFAQKEEYNYELEYWDEFESLTYDLIIEKKASLFVIYNQEEPINICMNMIYDKILFSNVSCYDIDYSAFNLGSIDMLKHIEWSFDNRMVAMDLLKGYFYYKQRWINHRYKYQYHYIYNKRNHITRVEANAKRLKKGGYFYLLNLLKRFNIHFWYRYLVKIKYRLFSKPSNSLKVHKKPSFEHGLVEPYDENNVVDLESKQFSFIKKAVFDFLYSNHEAFKDVKVIRLKEQPSEFLIRGKYYSQYIGFTR